MGAEFFHADIQTDGRTDMTKLIVAIRNFVNAPKNAFFSNRNSFVGEICSFEQQFAVLNNGIVNMTLYTKPTLQMQMLTKST